MILKNWMEQSKERITDLIKEQTTPGNCYDGRK
jgi:hypothetical protein